MGHQQEEHEITPKEAAELPDPIYREALDEVIAKHFGPTHKDCTLKIDAGSTKGDNYIGVVYRVTVDHPNQDSLSVIVKLPPQNEARREQFHVRPCFVREAQFYDTIFPIFTKFQEEKGIDVKKDGFYEVPKCFKTLTEAPLEGLYMEDVKVPGFEMFDRFKETSANHTNEVMKVLGKFHAISFALKDQRPEFFDPYVDMPDIFFQPDEKVKERFKSWFDMLKKQATDVLDACDDQDVVKRSKEFLEADFSDLVESCVTGKLAEPYAILGHGDCWNNNIMYRYENGVPVEIRLLDWQIMRYATPVCDLMYYIFGCTVKSVRDKHYNEFMNVYYKSLTEFMVRLGSDPSKMFPREVFEDQLKRFGKFGLLMAIMVLPVFTSNPEDTPDMDEMAEKLMDSEAKGEEMDLSEVKFTSASTIGEYNRRMDGVFRDMCRLGYI